MLLMTADGHLPTDGGTRRGLLCSSVCLLCCVALIADL